MWTVLIILYFLTHDVNTVGARLNNEKVISLELSESAQKNNTNFENTFEMIISDATKINDMPNFPKHFTIEPVFDIALPKYACFLACVRANNPSPKQQESNTDLSCYFRQHYRKSIIGKIILDGHTFRIKSPIARGARPDVEGTMAYSNLQKSLTEDSLIGNIPFSFVWDGDVHVLSDSKGRNILYRVKNDGTDVSEHVLPDYLGSKRIVPVPLSKGYIIFINFIEKQITVCQKDFTCKPYWKKVSWVNANKDLVENDEWVYAAGSAGVEVNNGVFVGFTSMMERKKKNHHDIWNWRLDTRGNTAYMFISDVYVDHELDSSITDPTSLVHVDDDWFLFTAESEELWRDYGVLIVNRVYQIVATDNWLGHEQRKLT